MDLDSLRCFVAVAESLHFRAASERVALSPAAVSERVRRVEEEVSATLFERTTRRVSLTDAGRRLLPHARRVLAEAAACRAVAAGRDEVRPFELTLGTRYELGLSWLCPALPQLAAERPERTLHLYMGDTGALLDRVERGTIDAAVLSARITRPSLDQARLHEEHYAFVTADEGPRTAAEARRFVLLDATPDLPLFRYLLDVLPDRDPWRFAQVLHLGGIAAIRSQVLAGRGVAVLPRYFVADDLCEGRLREILHETPPRSDHFRLVWRRAHPHTAELEALAVTLGALPLR